MRLVAVVAGIAGVVLCGLTPLLPVTQTTATITWPQGVAADGLITDVTAPLVSGAPLALDVSIPCQAVATLPAAGGLVLSTIPPDGTDASRYGLFVRATADSVVVAFRDSVAAVAPRKAVESGACSTLHIWANSGGVGADFAGLPGATGTVPVEKKPQIAGVFTDLKVAPQQGLGARIDVDTRFITAPTPLKAVLMALGVLATLASVVALAVLDRRGRRRRSGADIGSAAALAAVLAGWAWHVVGRHRRHRHAAALARHRGHVVGRRLQPHHRPGVRPGRLRDELLPVLRCRRGPVRLVPERARPLGRHQHRWGVDAAARHPGRHRDLAAAQPVGDPPPGPSTRRQPHHRVDCGRGVPRKLVAVQQRVAPRTAHRVRRGADVGARRVRHRDAPTVARRGGHRRRDVHPHARTAGPDRAGSTAWSERAQIASIIRTRRTERGLLAPIAALAASASLVFVIVFHDQTLATVAEAARIKYSVGPTISWYQEFLRYYFLTVEDSADSSLTRRFAVLVLLLCMFGTIAMLLRKGHLPGVARGPVWRLLGTTAIGLLLLTFTPTKWAVQFGAFAGLGAALAAVTAFTFARVGLHSRRNLALYVTALLFVLAWATSGLNAWFYTANYGVPWFDKPPVIVGQPVTTIFLVLAIITGLLAGYFHFRLDYAGHTEVENTGAQPHVGVDAAAGGRDHHGGARGRLDGQGGRGPLPELHHRQRQRLGAQVGAVEPPAAPWPTTCSSNPTPMPECCNRFRVSASDRTGRSAESTRQASPRTASATPSIRRNRSSPTPAPSTPTARPTSPASASATRRAPAAATDPSA